SRVRTLAGVRSESVVEQRSTAYLLALFASVGLLLGIAGVYGVISHRAAQRTREIGIRIALGASRRSVVGMVVGETLVVSLVGSAAGVGLAYVLSKFLKSMLFGITPHDPTTFVALPVMLLVAAMVAAAVPGVRASKTDPALTLRQE